MKYHPDKVAEKEKTEATEKFKIISRIHALLSDADQRKLYDDTGKLWIVIFTFPFIVINIPQTNNVYDISYLIIYDLIFLITDQTICILSIMDIFLLFSCYYSECTTKIHSF